MLVSLDILLDLREELKRGVPPTAATESKLANIWRKASKVCCEGMNTSKNTRKKAVMRYPARKL